MTKFLMALIALVFVFTITALAAERTDDPAAPKIKKTDQKKKSRPHTTPFHGEVKSVDTESGKLALSGKRGEKIFFADRELLDGIKAGDRVFVKYLLRNGRLTATAIRPAGDTSRHYGMHIRGEIKSVDASSGTIIVIGRKGETTFGADRRLLGDLKSGDKVYIRYTEKDGKMTATAIKQAKTVKGSTDPGK